MRLGEAIYKAQAAEAEAGGEGESAEEDGPRSVDEDIVDADFEDLDKKNRS
jgi:molecular chaperone DnaK